MDTFKKCSHCKELKPITEYNRKNSYRISSWCRECSRKRSKEYYASNREKHKAETKKRKHIIIAENKNRLQQIKICNKCSICPETTPICLDLHHTKDKEILISQAVNIGWSWKRIVGELKKCIILCSNCHRKYHAGLVTVDKSMTLTEENIEQAIRPRSIYGDASDF
jgi:hypothetical protein